MEKLQGKSTLVLRLEQRVPDTHSAAPYEHQWHKRPEDAEMDVSNIDAAKVLADAEWLLGQAPVRADYEYRVVLVSAQVTGWVVA